MSTDDDDNIRRRADDRVAAELESFRYAVAHDFRFPLRVIDGFSSALAEDYGDKLDDEGRTYIASIKRGVARLENMVNRLDELLRLASAELAISELDVSALARQVVEARRAGREDAVEIADGLVARGDRKLVEVALGALIDNAFKFTSKTAAPRISVGRKGDAFFVRDNGTGFDASAKRLFSPFRRLHAAEEFPGDGVGLAMVHRAVARHGGRVWAESTPGNGATIYFTLS